MSKASKEVDCLKRLDELITSHFAILDYIREEDLLTREETRAILSSSEVPKMLHQKLAALSDANKLQLLEYEWIVLPVERLKVTIVTDRSNREFSYGY